MATQLKLNQAKLESYVCDKWDSDADGPIEWFIETMGIFAAFSQIIARDGISDQEYAGLVN